MFVAEQKSVMSVTVSGRTPLIEFLNRIKKQQPTNTNVKINMSLKAVLSFELH